MRRADFGVSESAEVAVAEVVAEEDDDVRTGSGGGSGGSGEGEKEGKREGEKKAERVHGDFFWAFFLAAAGSGLVLGS